MKTKTVPAGTRIKFRKTIKDGDGVLYARKGQCAKLGAANVRFRNGTQGYWAHVKRDGWGVPMWFVVRRREFTFNANVVVELIPLGEFDTGVSRKGDG